MSQENVEIVRRVNELFSKGDLDGWAEHWDPEVVVTPPKGWPEGEEGQGIEAPWDREPRLMMLTAIQWRKVISRAIRWAPRTMFQRGRL